MTRILFTKQPFLIILLWMISLLSNAADPTTSASNVTFPSAYIDGGQFQVTFKSGNGTGGRIVVVKEGSDITGVPVDGVKYTPKSAFGTAGSEFTASGEYVVAHTTSAAPAITITNLKPATTYYIAIFELNGDYNNPATIDYSSITPTGKMVTTSAAPTVQGTITGFSSIAGNTLKLSYTAGNGAGRIIVGRKGSSVTALPTDLKNYSYFQALGSVTNSSYLLDAETYVVFKTSSASGTIDINNLEPNTVYSFAIYEYNGSSTPVYLATANSKSVTTNPGPTQPSSGVSVGTVDGDRLGASWNRGNGSRVLVVVKKGSAVTGIPVNGKTYNANAEYGKGEELVPGSGEYVVSNSSATSITVTKLEKFTTYHFAVFVFDVDGNGYPYYLTTGRFVSQSTALPPTGQTTLTVSNITGSSARLTYNFPASGWGAYRMLVIRDGAPVEFQPEDLVAYSGMTGNFGSGQLLGPNTYLLIGQANGGAPTVTGLTPGHTYYVTVFDMNGYHAPVYLRPGSSAVINVPNEPTIASSDPRFSSVDGTSMRFDWTAGNGARRIVVAREGAPVSGLPQDGVTYTGAAKFGDGTELNPGSGEYVVLDGTNATLNVTGLKKATTYHFAVFEYNSSATGPDYLTAAGKWMICSQATVAAPTIQVSGLSATNIQANGATLTYQVGNGSSRVFVMKQGAPVDVSPEEFKAYSNGSYSFGLSSAHLGNGNYVVAVGTVSNFNVSGLSAGTEYHIAAYEYNGNNAPVYLKPGATHHFTTTGGIIVPVPTQAAHSPVFSNVDGNKLTFNWSNGNGANRVVIARKGSAVDFVPADKVYYAPNASFGSSTDLGGGQYVVFNGNGNVLSLSNLEPNTVYYFAVFEYNGSASNTVYLKTPLAVNHSTATPPVVKSSNPSTTTGTTSITLSWTNGSGNGRVVVAKEGSEVTANPVDLTLYSANARFKEGPQVALGEYVVYSGTGNSVTVTELSPNKTYHFSVFEFNGSEAPVYNTSSFLKTTGITSSVLPVTWVFVQAKEQNGVLSVEWETAKESNTDYFEVERSKDGLEFNVIGKVKAAGNSNEKVRYAFVDLFSGSGKYYYRVKQVDKDRLFSYSKVVSAFLQKQQGCVVLQNPVQQELRFKCAAEYLKGSYLIVDAGGKIIKRGAITDSITSVFMQQAASGVYYLIIQDSQNKKQEKVAVMKQ